MVPFVGCKSDGQVGPEEAPEGTTAAVPVSPQAAQQLAFYKSAQGTGVLAPRGWYCFGIYGSSGSTLIVSPQPIDTANIFSVGKDIFPGPAIQLSCSYGGTSGRFHVAEVIARVFPSHRAFVTKVMDGFEVGDSISFGPYPADTLTYKRKTVVEYETPAQAEGLGTHSRLMKSGGRIYGVAILVGQTPDLVLLSVRLPADLAGLRSAIIGQVESAAAGLKN